LKNYIIIVDKYSRQYRVAIDLDLFVFLIINFKANLYRYKNIYKLERAIRQYNQDSICRQNLSIVSQIRLSIEKSIKLFDRLSINNNNKKNEKNQYKKNNENKKQRNQ